MDKSEVISILKSYIFLLKKEGIFVDKAYLFGSYLSGTATEDSDIDLMIVTETEKDDYTTGKIWNLTRKINSKIEPLIIGSKRFYGNESSPIVDMVKETGFEIEI